MKRPPASFCYTDHSKPVSHPYYDDHMNAHVRTEECERTEGLDYVVRQGQGCV